MPRPKSKKHPANVIGNAAHVMQIVTGEVEETSARTPMECQVRLLTS